MEVLPTPRRLENRSNQINKMIILLMAFSHNLHNLARYVHSFDSYILIITMESMHVQYVYIYVVSRPSHSIARSQYSHKFDPPAV